MQKDNEFLTVEKEEKTTIINVFNKMTLKDLCDLQLEKKYGYWCFSLRDAEEKFQKVVYKEEDINYILKLDSEDVITFTKVFQKDNGTYELGLFYGQGSVMYYEFFHDINRSTKCITQLNIDGSRCFKFDEKEGKVASNTKANFYDYSKLFNLIKEFQSLNNKYFDYLMKDHLTLNSYLDQADQVVK